MRFTPATQMQTGDVCFQVSGSGGITGSYTSGSEGWKYHEFTSSLQESSSLYQVTVTKGFSTRARLVIIGGGGSGGNTGTGGTYHTGGGGGGGEVIQSEDIVLYNGETYNIQTGAGGLPANPDIPVGSSRNGDDGEISKFTGINLNLIADFGKGGNGNDAPTNNVDGGESGNGFAGGIDDGVNVGGGGGGQANSGSDGNGSAGGNGGAGITINLPYSSPAWGGSSKGVAGGGGGGTTTSTDEGSATQGGGRGSSNSNLAAGGTRFTGGGGGGGEANITDGKGSIGGDGIVILMYPTGSCG